MGRESDENSRVTSGPAFTLNWHQGFYCHIFFCHREINGTAAEAARRPRKRGRKIASNRGPQKWRHGQILG